MRLVPMLLLTILPQQSYPQQVPLEALGPIAVGTDGSLHRIANWRELTKTERAAAHKALGRRNAKRLTKLRESEKRESSRWWRRAARWVRRKWLQWRLPPLDFAPEYQSRILDGSTMRATTRLCTASGEPHLGRLRVGQRVRATCRRCGGGASVLFSVLNITRVDSTSFGALEFDDALAATEGFASPADFRSALRGVYPTLVDETKLTVLHFALLMDENSTVSRLPRAVTTKPRNQAGSQTAGVLAQVEITQDREAKPARGWGEN